MCGSMSHKGHIIYDHPNTRPLFFVVLGVWILYVGLFLSFFLPLCSSHPLPTYWVYSHSHKGYLLHISFCI